jgi:hypothetical protein
MDGKHFPLYSLSSCDVRTWTALSSSQVTLRIIHITFPWSSTVHLGKPKALQIIHILRNKKVNCRIHRGPPCVPILSQINPSYFVNIYFNNILQSAPSLQSGTSLVFSTQTLHALLSPTHVSISFLLVMTSSSRSDLTGLVSLYIELNNLYIYVIFIRIIKTRRMKGTEHVACREAIRLANKISLSVLLVERKICKRGSECSRVQVCLCTVSGGLSSLLTLVKPSGYYMYRQFDIQQTYVLPTPYLCVLCGSENKQLLLLSTALTDWFV